MAKKQQSQALEVLSKLDGATLDSLLALLQGQQAQAVPTEAPQEQPKQEVAQPKAKVTKATLFQDRNRQVIVRSCVDGFV